MTDRRKKITIASIAGAIVIALVIGVILVVNLNKKPETIAEEIKQSTVGAAINTLTEVNGEPAATVIIAPPTEEWWWRLGTYTTNPVAYTLDFNKYSQDSKYIAYTLSPGANYSGWMMLGLPTTFIVYEDRAAAARMSDKLVADRVEHQLIEDIIFFVPEGAYSDVNYALNEYKAANENDELELDGKAKMYMEYESFKTFMTNAAETDMDAETFDILAGMLGITTNTYWSGESEDGFHWEGKFTGLDLKQINDPASIQEWLNHRSYMIQPDGTYTIYGSGDEIEETGVYDSGPSVLFMNDIINIRGNETVGSAMEGILNEDGDQIGMSPVVAPLPKDEGLLQININDVNYFLSTLVGFSGSLEFTTFESMSILVKDLDGTSTIDLKLMDKIIGEEEPVDETGDEVADEPAEGSETPENTENE